MRSELSRSFPRMVVQKDNYRLVQPSARAGDYYSLLMEVRGKDALGEPVWRPYASLSHYTGDGPKERALAMLLEVLES